MRWTPEETKLLVDRVAHLFRGRALRGEMGGRGALQRGSGSPTPLYPSQLFSIRAMASEQIGSTLPKALSTSEALAYLREGKCKWVNDNNEVCNAPIKTTNGYFNFYRHFFNMHPVKKSSPGGGMQRYTSISLMACISCLLTYIGSKPAKNRNFSSSAFAGPQNCSRSHLTFDYSSQFTIQCGFFSHLSKAVEEASNFGANANAKGNGWRTSGLSLQHNMRGYKDSAKNV